MKSNAHTRPKGEVCSRKEEAETVKCKSTNRLRYESIPTPPWLTVSLDV